MFRMAKWLMLLSFVALFAPPSASALTLVLCTESDTGGCVATIPGTATVVASDGEAPFDPFAFGFDTSDGIDFTGQFPQYHYAGTPGWVQKPGTQQWALPANLSAIGCGSENETTCEPVGVWNWDPGITWVSAVLGTYFILNSNGGVSDTITLSNNAPGGASRVVFESDPVPEPTSLVLLGTGIGALVYRRRQQMKRS